MTSSDQSTGKVLEIRLGPAFSDLSVMNRWFDEHALSFGVPVSQSHDVKLCLNEAVTNVMMHGFDGIAEGRVTVTLTRGHDVTRLCVRDNGIPFNPLDVPPPETPADVRSAKVGGLGIALIRSTASSAEYRREGGENVLGLAFEDRT